MEKSICNTCNNEFNLLSEYSTTEDKASDEYAYCLSSKKRVRELYKSKPKNKCKFYIERKNNL